MKLHDREKLIREAQSNLNFTIDKWSAIYSDLTFGELLKVISNVHNAQIQSLAKQMIREERHPENLDMPGGLTS